MARMARVAVFAADEENQRGYSTYPSVLVCHVAEEKIQVPVLLRSSSASECRRTVCPEQGCGGAT